MARANVRHVWVFGVEEHGMLVIFGAVAEAS
jgi:hypothetical protein